jgi:predicted dienelactone hydrolase
MRSLEIAVLLANVPLLAGWAFRLPIPAWGRLIPVLAVALMAIHFSLESPRLQMMPAYVLCILVFLIGTWPGIVQPGRFTVVVGVGLLLTSAVCAVAFPVFAMPQPTGDYPVGTVSGHLIDHSREETQGGSPHGPRELMIKVWYPAGRSGPGESFRSSAEVLLQGGHRLSLVKTNAASGMTPVPASTGFPLLIFVPSWGGRGNQNSVQAEELASHGFVVVGIDHPYSSELTIFPDGRAVRRTLGEWLDCSTDATFRECVRVAESQLQIRTGDVRFVLDEMERLVPAEHGLGMLAGRIDLSRIGIFGHSFGGAVAAEVCRTDARVKAGVNYDGAIFGEPISKGFGKPFLFFCDDSPIPAPADVEKATGSRRRRLAFDLQTTECLKRGLSEVGGYWLTIRGTKHVNYSDAALLSPVRRITHAGSIPPLRAMKIINAYTLAFFEKYVLGEDDRFLDPPSGHFEEVSFVQFVNNTL